MFFDCSAGLDPTDSTRAAAAARLATQRAFIAADNWARRSGEMLGRFLSLDAAPDVVATVAILPSFSVNASWLGGVVK